MDIFEEYSPDFKFMYSKISHSTDENDWYALPDYMYHIIENYNETSIISDDLVRISPIPEKVTDWLCKRFIENGSVLRIAVRAVFHYLVLLLQKYIKFYLNKTKVTIIYV